jgi:hypothetical protein
MINFLLWIFALTALLILGWGLRRRERMIQYPFLSAGVFMGWVIPQLIGLTSYPGLPSGALEKTTFMGWLCMVASWLGYLFNRKRATIFDWPFNRQKLVSGSILLSVLGAFFFFKVSELAPDVIAANGGGWTGIITIFVFLSNSLKVGLTVALILHLVKPSPTTLLIVLFDLFFYMHRILVQGRRAAMVELTLMVLLALWFRRRWAPKRWLMIAVLMIGTLMVNSIGDYRSAALAKDGYSWSGAGIDELLKIDYVGNLRKIAQGTEGNDELKNAAFSMEATDRNLDLDYGLSLWNAFVTAYIPAQLVGGGMKNSLLINIKNSALTEFRYTSNFGTTLTGLVDSFDSFWYFGLIKFFLIGFIMNRWWRAAISGNFVAQLVLMLSVNSSLHAITHTTHHFFLVFVEIAIFLLPILAYARVKSRTKINQEEIWSNQIKPFGFVQ